jgi:glycine cleavage system H protein
MEPRPKTLHYRRSHFATQLPVDYLYSPSHCWLAREENGMWRIGLTRFATRMLGEMVDHGFECPPGENVSSGKIVGWVEGFKAISDLYCVVTGSFEGGNPALKEKIALIDREPYTAGWLYQAKGEPDGRCLKVGDYRDLLDKTIDRILAKQHNEEAT